MSKANPSEQDPFRAALDWSYNEVLEARRKYLSPAIQSFQANEMPLLLKRGSGQYVWDSEGRKLIDCMAAQVTVTVGYGNERVHDAVINQLRELEHCPTMWMNPAPVVLAKQLVETMPEGDWVVHFLSSGTEALEVATLMARMYTGNTTMMSLHQGYQGSTTSGARSASGMARSHPPVAMMPGHILLPCPDAYHGIHGEGADPYVAEVKAAIEFATPGKIAGFTYEPVQGFAGVISLPSDYVQQVSRAVHEAGGLMIADEVQCGIARTGEHFWGFESQGVVPDMVVFGKGIGNGLPLSGVIARREIGQAYLDSGYMVISTHGSNPVMCAAGGGVLSSIAEDNLQENAASVGAYALERFRELKDRHEAIGDVRGRGLMLAIELVKDRDSRKPDTELATRVADELGTSVIVSRSGMSGNLLRLCPPLCITKTDMDDVADFIDGALKKMS